ncbi:MAG TPA: hypothetical protein VIJ42_12490 [Stellaceae bacterium]
MTPRQGQSPEYGAAPPPTSQEDPATLNPNRARGAVKLGPMRYVLAVSTIGAAIVLIIAYFVIAK